MTVVYEVRLGSFLLTSVLWTLPVAMSQTTETTKPDKMQAPMPSMINIIVPAIVTIICSIAIVIVIIVYLHCTRKRSGDKVSDAENGVKPKSTSVEMQSVNTATARDAESILNGAKDQLRELKSLEKNLANSAKEFKSLLWHATSVLKLVEEGIFEENEPKTLKEELFSEVGKRVQKDPNDHPDDDDDDVTTSKPETVLQKQNRLFTETNKVINEGKKHLKNVNATDYEVRNIMKDAKKTLTKVKEKLRDKGMETDKKKDERNSKLGSGKEKQPLLK